MKRNDEYEARREHLKNMSDEQLKDYFWSLAEKLTDPLLELGYKNTSPSIERSVLLRMGFSSLEAKAIVDTAIEHSIIAHGAGNIVYRTAKHFNMDVRVVGVKLAAGELWDTAAELFEEVQ